MTSDTNEAPATDAAATTPAKQGRKASAPATTQAEPTAARPIDDGGFVLDGWGLPISGPARAEALAARGGEDPALQPAPPVTE